MKPKDMNVGFPAISGIADLRKEDLVTKKQMSDFFLKK